MRIDNTDFEKIARLARLNLADSERDELISDINAIMERLEILEVADLESHTLVDN